MKRNTPTTTLLILLTALLVLLPLAYIAYSNNRQTGDLAAINARLDAILAITTRNSARIEQIGKANRALESTVVGLRNGTLGRLPGDAAPARTEGPAGATAGVLDTRDSTGYPYASAASLLETPKSYERTLNRYRERITAGGVSETVADFADRFATTESGQVLAGQGVAIESATCSDTECLIEGDLSGHPALNIDALSRLDPEAQEDTYYGFVREFYDSIREMGLPPSGALQRNGNKFYFYGRLNPRPGGRKAR